MEPPIGIEPMTYSLRVQATPFRPEPLTSRDAVFVQVRGPLAENP